MLIFAFCSRQSNKGFMNSVTGLASSLPGMNTSLIQQMGLKSLKTVDTSWYFGNNQINPSCYPEELQQDTRYLATHAPIIKF